MYKTYMRTALLAVALTMVSAASLNAQSIAPTAQPAAPPAAASKAQVMPDPDPCSKITGTVDGADQSSNTSSYNYGGYYSQPPADPKPQNPISATCGQGRLNIIVGTTPSDQAGFTSRTATTVTSSWTRFP